MYTPTKLKQLRLDLGDISQKQLADLLGCPQQTVARWETGRKVGEEYTEKLKKLEEKTKEPIYIIISEKYSNQPDEVTFSELQQMCKEMDWPVELTIKGNKIYDQTGEAVAWLKSGDG